MSRFIYADDVTDEQIRALRTEAATVGDDRLVATCDQALSGDEPALVRVASVLTDAAAQEVAS